MQLISLIPNGRTLISLQPEELAVAVLRVLNSLDDDERRRTGRRSNIGLPNYCSGEAQRYTDVDTEECIHAIVAAFQHLINIGMLAPNPRSTPYGWFVLTTRGKLIKTDADYSKFRHESLYPRGAIHPLIEQQTFSEFIKGDYETAVFKAFKMLEDQVRRRAGLGNEVIGVHLMRTAFNPNTGALADKTEHDSEREALMHLCAGAIGRFKNPASHRFTGLDDAATALEIIQLASLLLKIAEERPV